MAKQKRRGLRNPNGYGSISYLGKNRRNPYRVRITTGWEYNKETGKYKQLYATLGYYPDRPAAMIALAKYNESPYDLNADKITFAEAWESWSRRDFMERSYSSRKQLEAAYAKCSPLYDMRMKEIKKKHLQDIVDAHAESSNTAQQNIKTVYRNVYKFCMENDLVNKDYSEFVTIKNNEADPIHFPFTPEEIALLWDNLNTPIKLRHSKHDLRDEYVTDLVLILCYTGMRPGELRLLECDAVNLEGRYMIAGSKTEAGKNRIVPLHDDIFPLVEARVKSGNKYFVPYKIDKAPRPNQFREHLFDPLMEQLGLNHLPHDGRHTFSTFAKRYKMDDFTRKKIMGHKINDITDGVYTHKTPEELVDEVNKIIFYEK